MSKRNTQNLNLEILTGVLKNMSLAERKVFVYALSCIYSSEDFSGNVLLNKKKVAEILNIKPNARNLGYLIYEQIKDITKNSYYAKGSNKDYIIPLAENLCT